MNAFGSSTTSTNATPLAVNNTQPFTTLNYIVSLRGVFPTVGGAVPTEQFLGEVRMFAGNFAPNGWALANGQLLPINQNQALFSLLGTSYGGNGQTNFALPDLRGRSPVNPGSGPGLTARFLGEQGGTESESLVWPNHVHTITYPAVNLSVTSTTGTEANPTAITVTATAAEAVSGNQTVTLSVTGAGITAGDYSLSNTTLTILNGQTIGTVTFTVVNDAIAEGIETATLTISNPTAGIRLGTTTSQTITLIDNDSFNQVDFNQDTNTDLFWHNSSTGEIAFWAMNGATFLQGQVIDTVPIVTGWKPVGAGDLTGDGNTDILLRNSITGENGFWRMNGTAITSYVQLDFVAVDSGWDVVGVGDFTNDGKADVLWRNQLTGENGFWEVNGTAVANYVPINPVSVNSGWDVVGVGDFSGDRNTDILWRNRTTGENAYWEMNGATYIASQPIDPVSIESGWNIAGVGDFTKDNRVDIVWRNGLDGQAAIWEMNGNIKIGVLDLLPTVAPSTGWNLV
ncbi:MAG: tail fiber protein [Oscillatoriales cyanobacterium C42_A2020_001]|nr:tail fiber protein [Leptolyngbyaceae cyanobacterium C42_A2020_001]